MGQLSFVTGGARSGKSSFAERLAESAGRSVVYLATLEPLDEEMRDRIARHRGQRPAEWPTIEAPRALAAAVREAAGDATILLDCLSLWVSNRLLALGEEPRPRDVESLETALDAELDELIETARARPADTIVVSNEVGAGVVPPSVLGRVYRDLLGRANQRVSLAADRAWLLVAGRALELPPPGGAR
jgi:adenosylcobinamide kinase/adenosylcobinamide-phosphate guanylyltransferase